MKARSLFVTVFVAAAILSGGPALSAADAKKTTTIKVGACIDGRDKMIIQGGNMVWRNIAGDPVGVQREQCSTDVTTISAFAGHDTPAAPISWIPTYSGDDSDSGAVSSLSPTFDPGLPSRDMTFNISVAGHGYVFVRQPPTVDNGYQLVIEIDNIDPKPSMFTVTIVVTEK